MPRFFAALLYFIGQAAPKTASEFNERGLAYYNSGEYDKAIADASQALKINPNYTFCYVVRGMAYNAKKDYKNAIPDLEAALKLGTLDSSTDASVRNLLAEARNASGGSSSSPAISSQPPSSTNWAGRADPDAANWNIAALDTAANASYLSAVEKDVILELNKVRSNPKKYAELYLQPMLKYFKGRDYNPPGSPYIIYTYEGAAAVNECIRELSAAKSLGLLYPEKRLTLSARDHTADLGSNEKDGHVGSDGSTKDTRMKRYGTFVGKYTGGGENIEYESKTGRDIVVKLLIDDGVTGRGHRKIIMDGDYTQVGVGFGTHKKWSTVTTIDFADGYRSY